MTIETISEVDNTIFESLYADSLDDIVSGSLDLSDDMSDDDKKAFVKKGLNSNITMVCKKDNTPIAYGSGYVNPEYAYYIDGDTKKDKISHGSMFWFNFILNRLKGNSSCGINFIIINRGHRGNFLGLASFVWN